MTDDQTFLALKLFIEKADKLKNSNFVKNSENNSGIDLSVTSGKSTIIARRGADDENFEAFVLTFRFFIQDNETTSIRNMKDIFHSDIVTHEEKNAYDDARNHLNSYLDENTMFNINGKIKRRELMDVFIYGGLSHAKPDKKEYYDAWMRNPILAPFMQNEFSVILYEVLNVIVYVKSICTIVLEREGIKPKPT